MKNISIEQLCHYLPYKPQVKWFRSDDNSFQTSEMNIFDYPLFSKTGYRLILRPMSDLIKEITIDKKTFIPLVECFKELVRGLESNPINFELTQKDHIFNLYHKDSKTVLSYCTKSRLFSSNYMKLDNNEWIPQFFWNSMLCKWHFDTFGLIEEGMAFNLNEIKND